MKFLLEFFEYDEDDLNIISEIVTHLFLSEFDLNLNPSIRKDNISIGQGKLEMEYNIISKNCYLVKYDPKNENRGIFNKSIFKSINYALSFEFNKDIVCIENFSDIGSKSFIICEASSLNSFSNILDFEDQLNDISYIDKNEYQNTLEITVNYFKANIISITIWLNKFDNKIGVVINFFRYKIEDNNLFYKKSVEYIYSGSFGSNFNYLNLSKDKKSLIFNSKNYDTNRILEYGKKINEIDFDFILDIDDNSESDRFIKIFREKVLKIFSTDETELTKKLYNEFDRLIEYEIDADWQRIKNNSYTFDINYKNSHYILNVDYINGELNLNFKGINIRDSSTIDDFCQNVYLHLEEN